MWEIGAGQKVVGRFAWKGKAMAVNLPDRPTDPIWSLPPFADLFSVACGDMRAADENSSNISDRIERRRLAFTKAGELQPKVMILAWENVNIAESNSGNLFIQILLRATKGRC